MKGGYKIIDLGGVNLTSSATIIPGIYDALEGAHKPVLFEGVQVSGTEYKPQFAALAASGGNFLANFITSASATALTVVQIKVTSADAVTGSVVTINIA